jgi:hypothetical protein
VFLFFFFFQHNNILRAHYFTFIRYVHKIKILSLDVCTVVLQSFPFSQYSCPNFKDFHSYAYTIDGTPTLSAQKRLRRNARKFAWKNDTANACCNVSSGWIRIVRTRVYCYVLSVKTDILVEKNARLTGVVKYRIREIVRVLVDGIFIIRFKPYA